MWLSALFDMILVCGEKASTFRGASGQVSGLPTTEERAGYLRRQRGGQSSAGSR